MPTRESVLDPHLPAVAIGVGPMLTVADTLARRRGRRGEIVLAMGLPARGGDALASRLNAMGLDGADLVATFEPGTSAGSVTSMPLSPGWFVARRVTVLGLDDESRNAVRSAGAALGRSARGGAVVVAELGVELDEPKLAAFVEGFLLGGWAAPRWTAAGPVPGTDVAGGLHVVSNLDPGIGGRARTRALAVVRARILGATPANIKNPAWLAGQARALGRRSGLEVRVRGERELRAQGFGGLLAVGGGSATPPALVTVTWTPPQASPNTPHVVLVGKGITFDTGGLNIKPADGMLPMKTDMLGAAVVLAVLAACRDLGIGVRVTGLLPLAENAVSGSAYRPGDVITQYGGTTVEIGNTDAEGRIVLADALAHAHADLDPDVVIDIATLTGAARIALARVMAPVFGTDRALIDGLLAAAGLTGESLWELPMPATYRARLDSEVADLRQAVPGGPGAIMAAMFLARFVGDRPWAHLDIAGTGRAEIDSGLTGKGPTGFGARLLLRWLETLS